MPYIKSYVRKNLDPSINDLVEKINESGELCYVVYKLLIELTSNKYNFETMSKLLSEVECAKLEFYRRVIAPHEDLKIEDNGDI